MERSTTRESKRKMLVVNDATCACECMCAYVKWGAAESSLIWRQKRDEAEKGGRSREDQEKIRGITEKDRMFHKEPVC